MEHYLPKLTKYSGYCIPYIHYLSWYHLSNKLLIKTTIRMDLYILLSLISNVSPLLSVLLYLYLCKSQGILTILSDVSLSWLTLSQYHLIKYHQSNWSCNIWKSHKNCRLHLHKHNQSLSHSSIQNSYLWFTC